MYQVQRLSDRRQGNDDQRHDPLRTQVGALIQGRIHPRIHAFRRVGGKENLTSIDHCITRLRLEVKDRLLVDEKKIKSAGVAGVMRPSKTSVQVIVGTKVQFVADEMKKML